MAHKRMPGIGPKFKTEGEAAKWWYENRAAAEDALIKAMKDGTIRRGTAQRLTEEAHKGPAAEHPS